MAVEAREDAQRESLESGQAPPALAPPPGHPRFPAVDGARAIAALAVVVVHVASTTGFRDDHPLGWTTNQLGVGVTIFFVISGCLLYRPFVAGRLGHAPAPRLASFWQRRALRILPAYWAALVAVALVVAVGIADDHRDLLSGRAPLYFGLLQIYSGRTLEGGLPHAWTLCVEATFYLLLPGFAAAGGWLGSRGGGVRGEVTLIVALAAASVLARWILLEPGRLQWEMATLPTLFAWFAGGMLLAVASASGSVPRALAWLARRPLVSWARALVLYLGVSSPRVPAAGIVVEHLAHLAVALLVLIPAVMSGEHGVIARFLRWAPMAWLGLVSYGIYLWHIPVLWLLIAIDVRFVAEAPAPAILALTLMLTLTAAAASYYLVERPFLRLKHRGRLRI